MLLNHFYLPFFGGDRLDTRNRFGLRHEYHAILLSSLQDYTTIRVETTDPDLDPNSSAPFLDALCIAFGNSDELLKAARSGRLRARFTITEKTPHGLLEYTSENRHVKDIYAKLRRLGAEIIPVSDDNFVYG